MGDPVSLIGFSRVMSMRDIQVSSLPGVWIRRIKAIPLHGLCYIEAQQFSFKHTFRTNERQDW